MVDGAGVGPRAARTIRRAKAAAACGRSRKGTIMLWTIIFVLAIMWLLGFSLCYSTSSEAGASLGKDTAGISNRRGGLADLFPFYSFGESRASG